MKVILCTHNSGGVGKTSLAVHIAGYLADEGDVLLIDCDEQADAWQFYAGKKTNKEKDFYQQENISVITNSERKSLKKLVKPEQYDYVVLDMDTLLPNIVQVIIGSDPNIIFIPVNVSQKYKALEKLEEVLNVIYQLKVKTGYRPQIKIVPLGITQEEVNKKLESLDDVPNNCTVAQEMPNLQDKMQVAIYQDRNFIWTYPEMEYLKQYFDELINT